MGEFRALTLAREIVKESFVELSFLNKFDALYGQASRSAISVVSNLAEGNQRRGKDRKQLFLIAKGSLAELEEQLRIISLTKVRNIDSLLKKIDELHRIIFTLTLQSSQSQSQSPSQKQGDTL